MSPAFDPPAVRLAPALGPRNHTSGPQDQCGDLLRGGAGDLGQDRDVGVGGQRDARVAELVLHRAQVYARGQRERGRAVPKIVQPDRRQPGVGAQLLEDAAEPVGGQRVALEVVNTYPLAR